MLNNYSGQILVTLGNDAHNNLNIIIYGKILMFSHQNVITK